MVFFFFIYYGQQGSVFCCFFCWRRVPAVLRGGVAFSLWAFRVHYRGAGGRRIFVIFNLLVVASRYDVWLRGEGSRDQARVGAIPICNCISGGYFQFRFLLQFIWGFQFDCNSIPVGVGVWGGGQIRAGLIGGVGLGFVPLRFLVQLSFFFGFWCSLRPGHG